MSKVLHQDTILELAQARIDRVFVTNTAPADYAAAVAGALAVGTLVPGDFTIGAGDVSGRKVTFNGKSGIAVTATGSFNHAVFADSVNSKLWVTTDGTTNALNSGDTVNVNACDILELRTAIAG